MIVAPTSSDPLEDVLGLLDATAHLSTSMTASGAWAVAFDAPVGMKFNAVRHGECVLVVDGLEPLPLHAGDCFLLTRPLPFVLASDPAPAPVPAGPIFRAAPAGGPAHAGPAQAGPVGTPPAADDVLIIGGRFDFGEPGRRILLDALPPVVHVPGTHPAADSLRRSLELIDGELRRREPGSALVAEHLALVMLIQALRIHLAARTGTMPRGWLAGLADPPVAAALRAMHAEPARPWTVAELARAASVSRSTLAARFKTVVGTGPLDYLTTWRIELAADHLRRGETLGVAARAVGYSSESALSTAFKRVTGQSPRAWRLSS